jgi:hypothetical protein
MYTINNMNELIQALEDKVKIRFAGKLNRMKDNRVIWIPKTYLDQLKDFNDEQLLITIELEKIK